MIEIFDNRNTSHAKTGCDTSLFATKYVTAAKNFHQSIPGYEPTNLHPLPVLAQSLGLSAIWVKDESTRFDLNAFKGLGASYAIACLLGERLGLKQLNFSELTSVQARKKIGNLVFATATDGNHGRGVAWAAEQLDQQAAIFLPSHAAPFRVERIRQHGANTTVTQTNYDESVRLVASEAEKNGWVLVQDTAWEGYEDVPIWIMQGYLTMFAEAIEQLHGQVPTHVFIQAGVGSLAAALQGFLVEKYGDKRPLLVVVEPTTMASYFLSVKVGDGQSHTISDAHDNTIMACLAAGENSPLAWPILRDYADFLVCCNDEITEVGMRTLGRPDGLDPRIVSGESGAVTSGVLVSTGSNERLVKQLLLDDDSKVLLFSTEGAGDPISYKRITGIEP